MSFKLYYKGSGDTIYPMEFIPYAKGFKDDFDKVKKQASYESFGRENTKNYSWHYPLGIISDAYFNYTELAKPTDDSLIFNFIQRIGGSVDFGDGSIAKVTAKYEGILYLDAECTASSGISVKVSNNLIAFKFSRIANNDYTDGNVSNERAFDVFSTNPTLYYNIRNHKDSATKYEDGFKALSFRSPYSNAGDTSLDKFLKNMFDGEQALYKDNNTIAASPALSPFHVSSVDSNGIGQSAISMAHPNVMQTMGPRINAQYNNYASFYTVMKDTPIVAVDTMTFGEMKYRPAVVYRPDMFTAWDNLTYDVANAGSIDTYQIPSGYNQETIGDKNVWAIPLAFVQIGSGYLDTYHNKDVLNSFPYSTSKGVVFSGAQIGDDSSKNTFMAINSGTKHNNPTYNFMLCQAYPVTNLSKYVYEVGSGEVSRIRYGDSDNLIPYIFTVSSAYWTSLKDWGAAISNLEHPWYNSTAALAVIPLPKQFSNLTGQEMLDYFYGGKVSDWTPVEPVNPDIPSDDGNGGFNDSGQFGGNGTWSDSGVNTAVGGDPNTDPIYTMPDNLGLSGNYVIVKMSAQQLDELASTAWTEDSWLVHASKTMGISRIGEGVLSVKTCFLDIPETGQVNVTAIAGYPLPSPIGASSISQYTQFKFTPIPIPRFFGSFLDYAPYTEIVVELPFGQPAKIPPELVVGDSINITLRVDVMSETATYLITNSTKLIAQVPANVFVHLPFGSSEFTQSANSAAMSFINSAGSAADAAVGAGKQAVQASKFALPGMASDVLATLGGVEGLASVAGSMVSGAAGLGQYMLNQNESRNITQISNGGGPGSIGAMQTKTPVVKISRPYVVIPTRYYDLNGAPSGVVRRIGDCKGYLEVGQIYGAIPCNAEEYQAVCNQLKGGIFP